MDPLSALGPGLEVVKCACCPIARRINYLRNLQKNIEILTEKNVELTALENDLRRKLDKAKFQKKRPTEQGNLLLQKAVEMINKVRVITSSIGERGSFFFNCCSHLSLAKDVIKITQEVDKLLGGICQFTEELVVDQSLPKALELVAPPLVGKSTVEKNLDEILKSLRDPMIHKIGVYAMGGSGKTITMMNINNQLAKTEDFDKIIWVTVSSDYNLAKVQNDIAEQLNLNLSAFSSQEHRSSQLSIRLEQAKKFLIILDDVWARIPLDKVGIPEPNGQNGCKILLTTRSLTVCQDMETHKDIKLELLSKEEAWDLFVGDQVLTGEVLSLAKDMVSECGGLPLGIITVGRAMRGTLDVEIWRHDLKELRTEPSEIRGMEDDVFKLLRFSYNRLRNAKVQKCFLYLALYPEDVEVPANRLIRSWMNENFIKGGDLGEEIDEGFKILKELVDACLLEQFSKDVTHMLLKTVGIRMHDLLRDLAVKIMKDEDGVLVKAGCRLTEVPAGVEWNQVIKISLISNKIEALPAQLHCPHLITLLLCDNPHLETISSRFFDQTPLLRILDLSDTGVKELPSSLSNLLNLCALVLKGCRSLKKIPSVSKLKNLETLNLRGTGIEELPQGMEELISLRSLNLSQTHELSFDSIPKLQVLQELRMEYYTRPPFFAKKFIEDVLGDLNQLVILTLSIPSWYDYYLFVVKHTKWETLKNFCIRVGCGYKEDWISDDYKLLPKSMFLFRVVIDANDILPSTQELHVCGCGIPSLFKLLTHLKFLSKFIMTATETATAEESLFLGDEVRENAFTSLEYLTLKCQTFTFFWKGVVPCDCLSNLKVVCVIRCNHLKNMFVMSLLLNLKNIESIHVQRGDSMEQVVDQGDNDNGHANTTTSTTTAIVLPRLHTLILVDLPKLHTISHEPWVCPSLRSLEIKLCRNLKKLPFSVDTLSKLKELEVDREWWEELEWDDDSDTKALADLNSKLFQ